jgi:hypothetical protein
MTAHWRRKTVIALRDSILENLPQSLYRKRCAEKESWMSVRAKIRYMDVTHQA